MKNRFIGLDASNKDVQHVSNQDPHSCTRTITLKPKASLFWKTYESRTLHFGIYRVASRQLYTSLLSHSEMFYSTKRAECLNAQKRIFKLSMNLMGSSLADTFMNKITNIGNNLKSLPHYLSKLSATRSKGWKWNVQNVYNFNHDNNNNHNHNHNNAYLLKHLY